MKWRVRLLDGARREMRQAAANYEHERDGLGERFLDEVVAVRNQIAALPECYQQWPTDPEYRQAVVDVFPYVVFYRIDEVRRTLVIVAIGRRGSSREGTGTAFIESGERFAGQPHGIACDL